MENPRPRNVAGVPPVIVTGMHRSGTALVVRVLQELGVFAGWRREPNEEATLFLHLNEWILKQLGGRWDRPADVFQLLDNQQVFELSRRYLTRILTSSRTFGFLGPARFWRSRSLFRQDRPWGWKDPRNTLTLPLWLELFPRARVLHVLRHGIDVAASLQAREKRRLEAGRRQMDRYSWLYAFRPKRYGFVGSVRCLSIDGGLAVWDEYLQAAEPVLAGLGGRALQVRYEELLEDSESQLTAIADFCGLPDPGPARARKLAGDFDRSRGFAFRQSQALVDTARRHSSLLARWGYAP